MNLLKQSTASQEVAVGPLLDDDGVTAYTSNLANTNVKLFKGGATALVSKNSGGSTHLSDGIHYITLDATDTDTLGILDLFVVVTGNLAYKDRYLVVPAAVYDAMVSGSGNGVRASVQEMAANVVTASALATDAGTEIASAVLGTVVETEGSYTAAQALKAVLAVLAGQTTVSGNTYTVKTSNGNATRVTFTLNASKERTAVTTNL
jgi:hypothetical protein